MSSLETDWLLTTPAGTNSIGPHTNTIEKTEALLSLNPALTSIFEKVTPDTYRVQENSAIVTGHFGIVPGVLLKELFNTVNKIYDPARSSYIFSGIARPGDTLTVRDWSIVNQEGKEVLKLERRTPRENVSEIIIPDYSPGDVWHTEPREFLPHRDPFLFVTAAEMHPKNHGKVVGYFDIPDDFPFLENGKVPLWVIEESCAQILSLAHARVYHMNEEPTRESRILYGKSAIDKIQDLSRKIRDFPRIELIGSFSQGGNRAFAEYYCSFGGELFFVANIEGTIVPDSIFQRMIRPKR